MPRKPGFADDAAHLFDFYINIKKYNYELQARLRRLSIRVRGFLRVAGRYGDG